jgi:Phage portal protein, SPP1 Gp6-like
VPLSADEAVEQVRLLKNFHDAERNALDQVRRYWRGRQKLPSVIPSASPNEVKAMAKIARVNVCAIVVDTLAQSLFIDSFRAGEEAENENVWKVWQANKMDARQTGIHRATAAYGTAYAVVLPGEPLPVIRGASPRNLTVVYGEDPDWPMWALEKIGRGAWRLYDDSAVYYLSTSDKDEFEFLEAREHRLEVTPIVRYLDEDDLDIDDDVAPYGGDSSTDHEAVPTQGQVVPLMPVQDQIDLTTFGLLVAQWYSAFRQRYAIGWVSPTEKELVQRLTEGKENDPEGTAKAAAAARRMATMEAGASQLWQFDINPEDMKVGEFSETTLEGYIRSREASLRHAATLSQTPVHELIGEMVNLSAEALVAAENGRERKVQERQALNGESHEQTLWLAGRAGGFEVSQDAQVGWRDTSARAFNAAVEALGKMVSELGVPPDELWEKIPGATRQDVERWKKAAGKGDPFAELTAAIERQAAGAPTG